MTTTNELQNYMLSVVGGAVEVLSLIGSDFTTAITDTLNVYGVATVEEATDQAKLFALAKVQAWQKVASEVALDYDFKDDTATYNRSQMYKMATDMMVSARRDALQYAPGYNMSLTRVTYNDDPYRDDDLLSDL
jgi:hypothetical protein